jgi:hypothetical protein
VLFLHYNYPLCNIALGRFERWEAVVFLVGGDKLIKKGFFVSEGVGKTKSLFLWACSVGKTTAVRAGKNRRSVGERWTGGRKYVSPLGVPILIHWNG